MKTKEQEIEELEDEIKKITFLKAEKIVVSNAQKNVNIYLELIERAKLLKAEIEKGCGEITYEDRTYTIRCGGWWDKEKKRELCPKCQNIIERLNKIIGDLK